MIPASASDPAAAGTGPGAPTTLVGDPDGVPGSWLWLGPDLAVGGIWEVNQQMEDLFLFRINELLKNLKDECFSFLLPDYITNTPGLRSPWGHPEAARGNVPGSAQMKGTPCGQFPQVGGVALDNF